MSDGIFVKLYKKPLTDGLIAALGPERWQTLTVLSLFINEDGECYPSQDTLANMLNVRRETINRRIKALCDFEWNGKPLIVKEQLKDNASSRFAHNVYYISSDSGFSYGRRQLYAVK